MLIYILFLAGLVPAFGVVPIIVGFVMALLNRSSATGVPSERWCAGWAGFGNGAPVIG